MTMKAAQQLGRRRWEDKSEEEKAAHMKMMGETAAAKLTPEQRAERAKKAAEARWGKGKSVAKKKRAKRTSGT